MKKLITLSIITILYALGFQNNLKAQTIHKKQILLIGTFHFNNPNADAVKTEDFDITTADAQKGLETIANQIKKFNPNQVFVEWEYFDQKNLDSLYQLYLNNTYEPYINKKYKNTNSYNLYAKNEVFQLAFRAAKKTGLKQVKGIDYPLPMPFDTVMNAIKIAKQDEIMNEISTYLTTMTEDANLKRKTLGITELLLDLNTDSSRKRNNGLYLQTLNRAGKEDNFGGTFSVSEWYKRNLYMYSLVQKQLQYIDQRAVILLGAGHIAMIKKLIEDEGKYEIVELKDIMNLK